MSKARKTQLGVRLDKPTTTETTSDTATDVETGDAAESPEMVTTPGRPPGARNRTYDRGERNPGMCAKCKCTDSLAERTKTIPLNNDPEYTHVQLITCKCKGCGQWRVDRQKCNPAE